MSYNVLAHPPEVVAFGKRQVEAGGHERTGGLALRPPAVNAPAGTPISGCGCCASLLLACFSYARFHSCWLRILPLKHTTCESGDFCQTRHIITTVYIPDFFAWRSAFSATCDIDWLCDIIKKCQNIDPA